VGERLVVIVVGVVVAVGRYWWKVFVKRKFGLGGCEFVF